MMSPRMCWAVGGVFYPLIVYLPQIGVKHLFREVFGLILIRWTRLGSVNSPWTADSLGRIAKIRSERLTTANGQKEEEIIATHW